jgi:hypothetical protein
LTEYQQVIGQLIATLVSIPMIVINVLFIKYNIHFFVGRKMGWAMQNSGGITVDLVTGRRQSRQTGGWI